MREATEIISVKGLKKSFGDFTAVNGVDLQLHRGEVLGLLGPNGAGKTTLISMLSTILKPDNGSGTICGFDLQKQVNQIKKVVSVVPQDLAIYTALTARENLAFFADLYGLKAGEKRMRVEEALEIAALQDWQHKKVETFSGGMKRRLNLAIGLLNKPEVLFLDEPTVGVDPQSRNHIFECVRGLVDNQQMSIIYTTHYMEEAEALCDRIAIYDQGTIIAIDSINSLLEKYGEKRIELHVESLSISAFNELQQLTGMDNLTYENNLLRMKSKAPLALIESIFRILRTGDVPVSSFQLHESNLESIFITLTGKKLRD